MNDIEQMHWSNMTAAERHALTDQMNAEGEWQSAKYRLELPPLEHPEALSTDPASLAGAKPKGDLTGMVKMEAYINVGTAILTICVDGTLFIEDLYIVYWNRRKGYGEAFLKRIIHMARLQGITRIEAEIAQQDWDHHEGLKAFYEKCGFKVDLDPLQHEGHISISL